MNSEENYLDQLLNSLNANPAPARTMAEVMAERGITMPAPEPVVSEPVVTEQVATEAVIPEMKAMTIEPVIEESVITPEAVFVADDESLETEDVNSDTLADMLDLLDSPEMFSEKSVEELEVKPAASSEAELDQLLASVMETPVAASGVEEIPVVENTSALEEVPAVDDASVLDEAPILEEMPDLEAMLEGIGEPSIEEAPIAEEMPDLEAMLEGIGEPSIEEAPIAEEMPDLEAMLEGIGEPSIEEVPIAEEMPDLEAMLEGIGEPLIEEAPVSEEMPDLEAMLEGIGEPSVEEEVSAEEMVDADAIDLDSLLNGDDAPGEDAIALGEPVNEMASDDLELSDVPSEDELAAMFASLESGEELFPKETVAKVEEAPVSDLEALMAGLEEINSAPDPEPVANDEASALDMLDSIGDSGEDLLNLLEGIDDTTSPSDYEEIGALLDSNGEDDSNKKKTNPIKNIFSKLPFGKKKKSKVENAENLESLSDDNTLEESSLDDISELAELAGLMETESAEDIVSADVSEIDALLGAVEDEDYLAELESLEDKSEPKGKKGKKKKKKDKGESGADSDKPKGFFARLLDFLTEEIDAEDEDGKPIEEMSNADIIEAVDAENGEEAPKGKKKKEKKKKEKGKGKDKKAEGSEDGEGAEGEEGDDKKKGKKKKEKKVKEPKEPKEKIKSKPVLSKKAFIGLVAFCATLIAASIILSIVLPEHSDLSRARMLYYQQDYEGVYENLYGKKLNASDKILYDRASNILMLQRRLDSYNSRLLLGQEVAALDSLVEGVQIYDVLSPTVDNAIRSEFDAIFNEITLILSGRYGLSVDDCRAIYALDDATYTDVLYAVIYEHVKYVPGMTFTKSDEELGIAFDDIAEDGVPVEEVQETDNTVLEDVLPQEMDLNNL